MTTPSSKQLKLAIIVVTYNSADDIEECITSSKLAMSAANTSGTIVVVDNNSHDKSVKIGKHFGAHVIENKTNLGFAKAVNQGITFAMTTLSSDYFLLLNPDASLSRTSLIEMLKCLGEGDGVGAVGPMLTDADSNQIKEDEYYLRTPSWFSVLFFSTVLRPLFIKSSFLTNRFYRFPTGNHQQNVPQIPGACLLTTKLVLETVGLLDEDYAIWFEDIDWCYKARKKGLQLVFCPKALVIHKGGVSFDKWNSSDKPITFYVSLKTFFKKNKTFIYPLIILTLCLSASILWIKNHRRSNLMLIKALLFQKIGRLPN